MIGTDAPLCGVLAAESWSPQDPLFPFYLPHSAMKNSSKTSRNIYCWVLERSGSTEKFMASATPNSCGP